MAGQLWIREEYEHRVGVETHAWSLGYRPALGCRVTRTLLALDNGGFEAVSPPPVGDGVDGIALSERTFTTKTGEVGAGASDWVAGEGSVSEGWITQCNRGHAGG